MRFMKRKKNKNEENTEIMTSMMEKLSTGGTLHMMKMTPKEISKKFRL